MRFVDALLLLRKSGRPIRTALPRNLTTTVAPTPKDCAPSVKRNICAKWLAEMWAESGTPSAEICRKMGVSEATFYSWKKKFAGMGISDVRKLRLMEEENRKLKQLVADLSLDKHMLQEILARKP